MLSEFSQRRQAKIRDRIKETLEETRKLQQSAKEGETEGETTESSITITPATTTEEEPTITISMVETISMAEEEDDVMIID
jgi:hypothetical protein